MLKDKLSTSVIGDERFKSLSDFLKDHGLTFPEVVKIIDYSTLDQDGIEEDQWVALLIDKEGSWQVLEYFPTTPIQIKLNGTYLNLPFHGVGL